MGLKTTIIMVIKIRAFGTLEKFKRYTKSSFKYYLGCSAYSDVAANVFLPLALGVLTQRATSRKDTACSLSHGVYRVRRI